MEFLKQSEILKQMPQIISFKAKFLHASQAFDLEKTASPDLIAIKNLLNFWRAQCKKKKKKNEIEFCRNDFALLKTNLIKCD